MVKQRIIRVALLAGLSLVFAPTMLGQLGNCYSTAPAGQFCCSGTKLCLAHCVPTTYCEDGDTGYQDCSTSYGLCCDDQYSMESAEGEGPIHKYFRRAVSSEAGGMMFADTLLVPNRCPKRRAALSNGKAQSLHSKIDGLH